jgi:hypothetical protein
MEAVASVRYKKKRVNTNFALFFDVIICNGPFGRRGYS